MPIRPPLPLARLAQPLLAAAALAAASPAAFAQPQVEVASPIHDAGLVSRGAEIEHAFVLVNRGDSALEIVEVRPACGCTVTDYDRTIAAGGEGRVIAIVDTSGFRGPIAKHVTVLTNDQRTPRLQLTVRAQVEPEVEVMPGYVRYIHVVGSEAPTVEQHIWAPDGRPLRVLEASSPFPFLDVRYQQAAPEQRHPDGPEAQWRLTATLATDAPPGPLTGTIEVVTDHPDAPRVSIPVAGYVRPPVTVTPPILDLGQLRGDEPHRASVLVTHYGEGAVAITGVSSDVAALSSQVEAQDAGRRFAVRLTLQPPLPPGPLAGTLRIATDNELVPLLEVELRGEVR